MRLKWLLVALLVVGLMVYGKESGRVVYRPITAAQDRDLRLYTRELATYRLQVQNVCLPALHYLRRHHIVSTQGGKHE